MHAVRVRGPKGTFVKMQTKWSRWPAMIRAHRCGGEAVFIEITPAWPVDGDKPPASGIVMSANEAQAFAAWLSGQADHLRAMAARKLARADARRKKKEEDRNAG
jgi:hypothetical protein